METIRCRTRRHIMDKRKKLIISGSAAVALAIAIAVPVILGSGASASIQGDTAKDKPTTTAAISEAAPTNSAITETTPTAMETAAEETANTAASTEAKPQVQQTAQTKPAQSGGGQQSEGRQAQPRPEQSKPAPTPKSDEKIYIVCTCGARFNDSNEWEAHYNSFKKAARDYADQYGGFFPSEAEEAEYERLYAEWWKHDGWKTSDAL
jgi:cytoskeletal protein RodZ